MIRQSFKALLLFFLALLLIFEKPRKKDQEPLYIFYTESALKFLCFLTFLYLYFKQDMYIFLVHFPCTFSLSIAWICLLIPSIVCLCIISCLFGLETHTPGFSTYLSIYPYIYLSIYPSMYESKAKQRPA